MKKMWYISIIFISHFTIATQKGVVIVPVADLVGQPQHTFDPQKPVKQSYQQLSWSARGSDYAACPRIHQLLLHEIVDIIEFTKDEVRIKIPNVFYQQTMSKKQCNEYWTLRKNIILLNKLEEASQTLPSPICFTKPNNDKAYKNSVTLTKPYCDPIIGTTLSVGTRFVKTNKQTKNHIMVYRLNPQNLKMEIIAIPKNSLYTWQPKALAQRLKDFVQLLQQWSSTIGTLPYLWGGCSFTQTYKTNRFDLNYKTMNTQKLGFYTRPHDKDQPIKTGFDCSNIILRAAQIVGIPYFFKNTYTIAQNVPPLSAHESLQVGDIIWIQGHVLVVSDLKNNRVIEAHAYDSGYGKIHEIPISKVFQGITSFQELETAHKHQTALHRLNSMGTPFCTYKKFKLLRILPDNIQ